MKGHDGTKKIEKKSINDLTLITKTSTAVTQCLHKRLKP